MSRRRVLGLMAGTGAAAIGLGFSHPYAQAAEKATKKAVKTSTDDRIQPTTQSDGLLEYELEGTYDGPKKWRLESPENSFVKVSEVKLERELLWIDVILAFQGAADPDRRILLTVQLLDSAGAVIKEFSRECEDSRCLPVLRVRSAGAIYHYLPKESFALRDFAQKEASDTLDLSRVCRTRLVLEDARSRCATHRVPGRKGGFWKKLGLYFKTKES